MPRNARSLNVIGLISGGKDSFFSLLHCLANDHNVVALANLYPPEESFSTGGPEDLNSFMYQTVGHAIIPLYSQALDLPLYRQEILGSALNQSKDYGMASESNSPRDSISSVAARDETESLIPLLRTVIATHPTANAICSGAILSSYQRTRIESIARRLNLIPLSYLWQFPSLPPPSPGGLLDDMAAIGFDVRIVKVASGGLDEDLLWRNLMDPAVKRKLEKGVGRFGGSVLGEGGEYETLVVDGPMPFWTGRIEVQPSSRSIARGSGGEAWIEFKKGSGALIQKQDFESTDCGEWKRTIRVPERWDTEFKALVKKISTVTIHPTPSLLPSQSHMNDEHVISGGQLTWEAPMVIIKSASTLTLYNVSAAGNGTTAGEQMLAINSKLLNILIENGIMNAENIIFTTMLLRRMADFASVNETYGSLFTKANPPARVTIGCGDTLPRGVQVMVSFVCSLDGGSRKGLHMQSRSYWAPANIGPYSQAISVPLQQDSTDPSLVYVAGQIPLVPASMEVLQAENHTDSEPPPSSLQSYAEQASLALQHLWRCGEAMRVSWWTSAIAFIVGGADVQMKAMLAWTAWEEIHQAQMWGKEEDLEGEDELDGLDAWDRKYGGLGSFDNNEPERRYLPDFKRSSNSIVDEAPHFLAVQVDELPRGCEIEWQSCGIAYRDPSTPTIGPIFEFVDILPDDAFPYSNFSTKLRRLLKGRMDSGGCEATVFTSRPDLVNEYGMQIVPCQAVWGAGGKRLAAGVVIHNRIDF